MPLWLPPDRLASFVILAPWRDDKGNGRTIRPAVGFDAKLARLWQPEMFNVILCASALVGTIFAAARLGFVRTA
jgi:hypothetical protein